MKMAIEKLSEDLVMEILCRLPVKSLLQFKSVCKNWYAIIHNPTFICLQHDRSASIAATQNTDCLLIKRLFKTPNAIDCLYGGVALTFVPYENPVHDIDLSPNGLDTKHLQILGPCFGVVCLTTSLALNSTIVLCNPSIKEFRVIPQPSYKNDHFCNLGFGFDSLQNDYKVVRFAVRSRNLNIKGFDEKVEIYNIRTDSWREVDTESPIKSGFLCSHHLSASWNGDFYWYANHRNGSPAAILAFSMTNEVFKELPVPEVCMFLAPYQQTGMQLFILKDSLALVIYRQSERCFDIWVMNEEDVEVSWTKKFSIGPFQELHWALGFRQNGEFLVRRSCGLTMSCDLNTRERKEYQVDAHFPPPYTEVLLYTESLVSVKRHDEHDGHVE